MLVSQHCHQACQSSPLTCLASASSSCISLLQESRNLCFTYAWFLDPGTGVHIQAPRIPRFPHRGTSHIQPPPPTTRGSRSGRSAMSRRTIQTRLSGSHRPPAGFTRRCTSLSCQPIRNAVRQQFLGALLPGFSVFTVGIPASQVWQHDPTATRQRSQGGSAERVYSIPLFMAKPSQRSRPMPVVSHSRGASRLAVRLSAPDGQDGACLHPARDCRGEAADRIRAQSGTTPPYRTPVRYATSRFQITRSWSRNWLRWV